MSSGFKGKATKAKVKNKAPADVQITAEQLMREAKERDLEIVAPPPTQKISDPDELADYQIRKRKYFEDEIRKNRLQITNWLKYAKWEESQQQIHRARSVFERALDVDHRNITLWIKYAEMEMSSKQVNHARNIFDRAVTILPRANQFWYKYVYMEEMLKNVAGCRQVFERWVEWEPEEQAWLTFIKFELRYGEVDRARRIYARMVGVHPTVQNWIRFARFEEGHHQHDKAREVYEKAVEFFGDDYMDEKLFIAFARFEESQKEFERVRVIFKYARDRMPKEATQELFKQYTVFEKKHGDRSGIESVILAKRRQKYEDAVAETPEDYDAWIDYVRLMEECPDVEIDAVRQVYERAIACIPPRKEKHYWRRYIYLWIYYALYEELTTGDLNRARDVYQFCLKILPHSTFTFAKIWIMAAKFEIRQRDVTAARRLLGRALGMCPKDKLFREYIDLEIQLREFDRCRTLYQKYVEFGPENVAVWVKFAELEAILSEMDRARGLFEIAISQPRLDMPEVLWKAYIDFEVDLEEYDRARLLYERLLERTQHVKVWISFARFELVAEEGEHGQELARGVFRRANERLKNCPEKEARLMLLEAWQQFEEEFGSPKTKEDVAKLMPRRVKKRRRLEASDGGAQGEGPWEEYIDYIFPTDENVQPHVRLLEMAKNWKQSQAKT